MMNYKILFFVAFFFIALYFTFSALRLGKNKKQLLSPTEFQAYCDSSDNEQILDIRRPEEWESGVIENTYLINWFDDSFIKSVKEKLDKDQDILIYCKSGNRSSKVAIQLTELGFNVLELKGGITAWNAENRKTVNP